MKQKSIIIGCYAMLNLAGGVIGYLVANSIASLVSSSIVAIALWLCALFILKGSAKAYTIATAIVCCLWAFFSYRFFLTQKLAPGGIMAILSAGLFLYLVAVERLRAYK